MDRAEILAQVIWPCFAQRSHNQESIFQRAGSMIPMSQCSCCGLMLWMLPNAWLCYRWIFRRTLVADGNFTADHMKMRCPEDDVNLTHDMDMWLRRAGTNSICLMHRSSKRCHHLRPYISVENCQPISPRGLPVTITRQSMLSIPIGTIWSQ